MLSAIAECVSCSCPYEAYRDVWKGSVCSYDDIKLSSLSLGADLNISLLQKENFCLGEIEVA